MLSLIHRYEGLGIDFNVLMGKVSTQQSCMALWDCWQRYMDVSQLLRDLPELEVFRHLDPPRPSTTSKRAAQNVIGVIWTWRHSKQKSMR